MKILLLLSLFIGLNFQIFAQIDPQISPIQYCHKKHLNNTIFNTETIINDLLPSNTTINLVGDTPNITSLTSGGSSLFYYGDKKNYQPNNLNVGTIYVYEFEGTIDLGTWGTYIRTGTLYITVYNYESDFSINVSDESVLSGNTATLSANFTFNGVAHSYDQVYSLWGGEWSTGSNASDVDVDVTAICNTPVTYTAENSCFTKSTSADVLVTYDNSHAGSISTTNNVACYGDDANVISSLSEFNSGNACSLSPIYSWWYKNNETGNSWVNIAGANSLAHNPEEKLLSSTEYQRRVTLSNGQVLSSNTVTILTGEPNPGSISIDDGGNRCYNSSVSLEEQTGVSNIYPGCAFSYVWEMADNSSFTINKETLGGKESPSALSPILTSSKWFRRNIIINGITIEGPEIFVEIEVPDAGTIKLSDYVICDGATVGLIESNSSASDNNGFSGYQWYISSTGNPGSFFPISGATGSSYTDSQTQVAGYKHYKREAQSVCINIPDNLKYTSTETIEIKAPLDGGIVTSAKNLYCYNEAISDLSINANNGARTVTYNWQFKTVDGTAGWSDPLTNSMSIDNSNQSLNLISTVNDAFYNSIKTNGGAIFRRIVTEPESGCIANSDEFTITSYSDISGGGIGTTEGIVCESDLLADLPSINNDNTPSGGDGSYVFKWEYKNSGETNWNEIASETSISLSLDANPGVTRSYRRWVHDGCLSINHATAKYSNIITHTYKTISIEGDISDVEMCEEEEMVVTSQPYSKYEWNLNNTVYSNGSQSYTKFLATSDNNLSLRVTDNDGCVAETSIDITVNSKPRFTMHPIFVCEGSSALVTAPTGYSLYEFEGRAPSANNTTSYSYDEALSDNQKSVIATDSKGCESDIITFTASAENVSEINLSDDYVCSGESKQIAISATPFIRNVTWSDDNGIIVSGPSTYSIMVSPTETTTYYVDVENDYCSSSSSMVMTVRDNPEIHLRDTFACYGSNLTLTTNDPYLKHYWNTNNGLDSRTSIINVRNSLENTLLVIDEFGCTDIDTMDIEVKSLPSFISPEAEGCVGDDVTLTAPGGYEYFWSTGEKLRSISREVESYGHPDNTVQIRLTDDFGCQKTENAYVLAKPTPTPASITSQFVCEGQDHDIILTSSYDNYLWSDGITERDNTINLTENTEMWLRVGNEHGCFATSIFGVFVNEIPVFDIKDTTKCNDGGALQMMSPLTGVDLNYNWSNYSLNSTSIFNLTSSATLWLEVTKGICSHRDSFNVQVFDIPIVSLPDTNICLGDTLNYTYGEFFEQYLWSTGETTPSISKQITTNASYLLQVTDANGCVGTGIMDITKLNPPTVFISGDHSICEGDQASLSVPGSFPVITWSNGESGPTLTETLFSNTEFSVIVEDVNGCDATDNLFVEVHENPIGELNDTAICDGDFAILTHPGDYFLSWSTGASGNNVLFKPNNSVTIYLTLLDANGCFTYDSTHIEVRDNPLVSIPNESVCEGDSVLLASPQSFDYMMWSTGDTTSSIWYYPTTATNYLSFNFTDSYGCSGFTDTRVDMLSVIPFAVTSKTICEGGTTTLSAQIGFDSYLWSTGETTATIVVSPTVTTDYTVDIIDNNGCSAEKFTYVAVNPNPVFEIEDKYICPGLNTTASGPLGNYSYQWSNGVTSRFITIPYASASQYSLTLIDRSTNCQAYSEFTAHSISEPEVYFTDTALCTGQSIQYHLPPNYQYIWYDGISGNVKTITPTRDTEYNVAIIDTFNCTANRNFYVTVNTAPQLSVEDVFLCEESSINLTVPNATGFNYQWSNGSTNISTIYLVIDTVYGWVSAQNAQCSVSDSFLIVSESMPELDLSNQIICAGDSLLVDMPIGYNYQWSNGDTTQSSSFNEAGNYFVLLTTNHQCHQRYDFSTTIETLELTASVEHSEIDLGQTISLVVSSVGGEGVEYNWLIQGEEFTGPTIEFTPIDTGVVDISVIAESINGCISQIAMPGIMRVLDTTTVDTTNTTPIDTTTNGKTDLFTVKSLSVGIYPNPAAEILNIDTREYSLDNEIKFSILDINGRVLMTEEIEAARVNSIDVNHLQEGYYILLLDINGLTKMSRIIIER